MQFLDPLEIDDRDNAYLEVGMLRDIEVVGYNGTVEALIEQQVDIVSRLFPVGKSAGFCAEALGLALVMNVMPHRRLAGLAEFAKCRLQPFKQVGFGPEMTEMLVAFLAFFRHDPFHFCPIVTMKRVALDVGSVDALAAKDLLERMPYRCRAGTGGARDRDYWMRDRHWLDSCLLFSGSE